MQELSNEYVTMQYENHILRMQFHSNVMIDSLEADQLVYLCTQLTKNDRYATLSIAEEGVQFSREARHILATRPSNIFAAALISKSHSLRITANLFLKLNRPFYPTRFFTNEIKGRKWIQEIAKNEIPNYEVALER